VDPLAPGEVLEVAVLAHGDERDLREVGVLAFALTVRALLPAFGDEFQLSQPVASPAEVPQRKAEERDGEVKSSRPAVAYRT
jgi:hypothetical protein